MSYGLRVLLHYFVVVPVLGLFAFFYLEVSPFPPLTPQVASPLLQAAGAGGSRSGLGRQSEGIYCFDR